jgi:hypothetical protein
MFVFEIPEMGSTFLKVITQLARAESAQGLHTLQEVVDSKVSRRMKTTE